MEKQVRNLQFTIDTHKNQLSESDNYIIYYNLIREKLQGCISLSNLLVGLHPLSMRYRPKKNNLLTLEINRGNFQINILQTSTSFNINDFFHVQKIIFLTRLNKGSLLSFTNFDLNIFNSLIHIQSDFQYHTQDSSLNFITRNDITNVKEKNELILKKLHEMSLKLLNTHADPYPFFDSNEMSYFTNSQEIDIFNISKEITPELEINQNPNFQDYIKMCYH